MINNMTTATGAEDVYALSADKKFELCCRRISLDYPSFLQFYAMMQRKPIKNDKVTIRLNTKSDTVPILEYTEEFVQAIHPITLTVLTCVEILRLLLHHVTSRKMAPYDICWNSSNIVCSPMTVTKMLNELNSVGNRKKGQNAVRLNDLFPSIDDFAQIIPPGFDPQKDMYLEKIFNIFMKNREQYNQQMQKQFGGGAGGQGGAGGDQGNDQGGNGGIGSEEDALKKHFSQSGSTATDGWGENEIVDQQVSQAVNKASTSTWSNLPGGLAQQILAANAQVVDPRIALRRFTTSVFSDVMSFSRMKFPRRYGQKWIGVMPGPRHEQKAEVLIAIDCSGSMPDSEVEKACMVVNDFVKHAKVHYCFWDGACGPIAEKRYKTTKFDLSGRGCTNPQCVIDKIQKEGLHYDGIVYITDCQFSWEKPNIKMPIFIIQSKNADPVPEWCKYSMTMKDVETISKDR